MPAAVELPMARECVDVDGKDSDVPSVCSPLHPPQPPTDTVIFWDWDDTLLCSSFLTRQGYGLDTDLERPEELERQLRELEQSAISVLELTMQFGDVHVVTNAERGWVQLSAQKFLPGLLPLLERLPVLSARTTFETHFPDSPLSWKFKAFQQKLSPFLSNVHTYKNILSFGDSHVERQAVHAATRGFPNTKTKSVKFAERPSILQLQRQIDLVFSCFKCIHDHDEDLDLALTIKAEEEDWLPPPLVEGPVHDDGCHGYHDNAENIPPAFGLQCDPNDYDDECDYYSDHVDDLVQE